MNEDSGNRRRRLSATKLVVQREDRTGSEARRMDIDSFVVRRGIQHYRDLLDTGGLDDARRRTIETLLVEEEAKLPSYR